MMLKIFEVSKKKLFLELFVKQLLELFEKLFLELFEKLFLELLELFYLFKTFYKVFVCDSSESNDVFLIYLIKQRFFLLVNKFYKCYDK